MIKEIKKFELFPALSKVTFFWALDLLERKVFIALLFIIYFIVYYHLLCVPFNTITLSKKKKITAEVLFPLSTVLPMPVIRQ